MALVTLMHLIDWATGASSFAVKFYGWPAQLRRNREGWREGSGPGTAPRWVGAMCVSYCLWVVHGLACHDWVEVASQGMGVLTTGALLIPASGNLRGRLRFPRGSVSP